MLVIPCAFFLQNEPATTAFWQKYFPPNGWNCRCTTLEIWKDDAEARIDFGITGRDPRKRTADDMNVPKEFRGNVGVFAVGKPKKEEPAPAPESFPSTVRPLTQRDCINALLALQQFYGSEAAQEVKVVPTPAGCDVFLRGKFLTSIQAETNNDVHYSREPSRTFRTRIGGVRKVFRNLTDALISVLKGKVGKKEEKENKGKSSRKSNGNATVRNYDSQKSNPISPKNIDVPERIPDNVKGLEWRMFDEDEYVKLPPAKQKEVIHKSENFLRSLFSSTNWVSDDESTTSNIEVDLKEVDFRIVNRFVGGLEHVVRRFPFLKNDSLSGVYGEDMGLVTLGRFDPLERTLKITSRRNYEHIKRVLFEEKRDGAKSTAHINGIIYHEMGHALHSFVASMAFEHSEEIKSLNVFLLNELMKVRINDSILSKYGKISIEEMVAECFAEYMAEENPREFAIGVVEEIIAVSEKCEKNM